MPDTVSLISIDKKLAVLCERMAYSQKVQEEINTKIEKHIDLTEKRLRGLENCRERTAVQMQDNRDELSRLRSRSNLVDAVLAVGTAIAGILGINHS